MKKDMGKTMKKDMMVFHKNEEFRDKYAANIRMALTVFKYLFSLALLIAVYIIRKDAFFFAANVIELLIIIVVSNEIVKKNRWLQIIHFLLILLFNVQAGVFLFSGTRLSLILISNIDMAYDLSGMAAVYRTAVVLVVIVSFIPIVPFENNRVLPGCKGLSLLLALELALTMAVGNGFSVFYGYVDLLQDIQSYSELKNSLAADDESYAVFYRGDILCFAPTICDYLDISAPNYFLGKSLFTGDTGEGGVFYDTVFYESSNPVSTKKGRIEALSSDDLEYFQKTIKQYFSIARNGMQG